MHVNITRNKLVLTYMYSVHLKYEPNQQMIKNKQILLKICIATCTLIIYSFTCILNLNEFRI